MADISEPALEKALAKVKQLVPSAKIETKVYFPNNQILDYIAQKKIS